MIKIITCLILLSISFATHAQDSSKNCPYIKTATGYLMVLRRGDDVLANLEQFTKTENIPFASFTGIGFASNVTFGFFDAASKKFNPRSIPNAEMGSITGSIAWKENKPSLHIHGVAAGADFVAYAGHILALKVGTGSMEIYITTNRKKLERKMEEPPGANVLGVGCGE